MMVAGGSPPPLLPPLLLPPLLSLLETDPPDETSVGVGRGVGLDVVDEVVEEDSDAESNPPPNPPGETPVDEGPGVGPGLVDDVVDVDSDGESNGPAKPPGFGAGPAPGLVRDGESVSGVLSPPSLDLGDRASRMAMLAGWCPTSRGLKAARVGQLLGPRAPSGPVEPDQAAKALYVRRGLPGLPAERLGCDWGWHGHLRQARILQLCVTGYPGTKPPCRSNRRGPVPA